ncbi:DUF4760 domain-containing protein [Serratia ureilytica]|uniref:DUF4760 domain-containing protein n=1 Tax=Serratia ureilytica TaxID=300181 RepID=UPI00313B3942
MALSDTLQAWVAYTQIFSSISVGAGVLVAAATIVYNVKTAKKSLTATFLYESRFDKDYIDGLRALMKVHNSGKSFRVFAYPTKDFPLTEDDLADRLKITYCLNFYERMAVSIHKGIYDCEMVKDVFHSSIVNNYATAEPFIKAIREIKRKDTYYQEFEKLATAWKKKPLKIKR